MKKILYIIISLLISISVSSQNLSDAFKLSSTQINGTARSSGIGNAVGSLGSDFTSLSINPAGVGLYRNNEFVVSPSFNYNNQKVGKNFKDYKISINNIGIVFTPVNKNKMTSFNWSVGINTLSNFDQSFNVENNNSPASFIDDMVYQANYNSFKNSYLNQDIGQININHWITKLGWDTYLFDPALDINGKEIDGKYVAILYQDEKVNQKKQFNQYGKIDEFVINGGVNINHILYIGATLGIDHINLNTITSYSEYFGNDSFTFTDDYALDGDGFNLKLGVILKPVNFVRLGLAFHTPTYYSLTQTNIYSIESMLLNTHYSEGTNNYEYRFYTPFKTILSGSIVGRNYLFSVDAEMIDYSTMKFQKSDLSDLNSLKNENFKGVLNIRAGGEVKLFKFLSLRGGYELYGNPYESSYEAYEPVLTKNISIINYGVGLDFGKIFTDFAYKNMISSYKLNEIQPNFENIDLKNINNKFLFTLGYRF